jgi:hypothetical protein
MTMTPRTIVSVLALAVAAFVARPALAEWPLGLGSSGDNADLRDAVVESRASPTGDVIVAGNFHGTIETTLGTLTSAGLQDVFVARISPTGELIWIQRFGGISSDTVHDLALDDGDNAYIVGEFFGSVALGGTDLESSGLQDGFVAKIGAGGSWQWARRIGGTKTDRATAVATLPGDSTRIPPIPDSVIVGGSYQNVADVTRLKDSDGNLNDTNGNPVGDGALVGTGADARDLFLVRYTTDGDGVWAVDREDTGNATGEESVDHIEIDASGRAWVIGGFAEGGTTAVFGDDFNDLNLSSPNWSSSDASRGSVTRTEGSLSWFDWREACLLNGVFCDTELVFFSADYSFFTETGALGLRGGAVTVDSPSFDTSESSAVRISLTALRGFPSPIYLWGFGQDSLGDGHLDIEEVSGVLTDELEDGEDLLVKYYGSDLQWHEADRLSADGPDGGLVTRAGDNAISIRDPRAFHAGFRIRLERFNGGPEFTDTLGITSYAAALDWWHVDDVAVEKTGRLAPMLFDVTDLLEQTPTIGDQTVLPRSLSVHDIALANNPSTTGNLLYVAGSISEDLQYAPGCGNVTGPGAYVAAINLDNVPDPTRANCVWADAPVATGSPSSNIAALGLALDNFDNVYATGTFDTEMTFFGGADAETLQTNSEQTDIFIASWDPAGLPRWATGGGAIDDTDGIPAFSGGSGADGGLTIATDGVANVYVGGFFEAVAIFGEDASITALNRFDPFVANLSVGGLFFEAQAWTAGVPLVPPANANVDNFSLAPDFRIDGEDFDALGNNIFEWQKAGDAPAQLIPLQPIANIEVRWRIEGDDAQDEARISSIGGIAWPTQPCADNQSNDCYQVHVVDAPVDVEPPSGYRVLELIDPNSGSSNPVLDAGVFTASRTGTAVLVYINGPELDPLQYPTEVEIVRTLPATATPLTPRSAVPVEIGEKITDPHHDEVGRTGFVANELAYYDGAGPDAAYRRGSRAGQIIPVNRINPGRNQDAGRELVVAWYHEKAKGVFWPEKGVRYAPFWPLDPERIIIASEQGSEVFGQDPLNPLVYEAARIYVQDDRTLPGYNPNDEHALLAPSSTGTPFEAVFALRSDYGKNFPGDESAASDPYVLVKYFDAGALEWKFRVFEVEATGGGFNRFRYSGTAGTTVAPPYPVSLLVPGCAETFVVGQAQGEQPPPPFFQDYKNQLWAKSAGEGAVRYFYPAQPGFFVDLDNDDQNNVTAGECVPWLARLPENRGGSGSVLDPILVEYDIRWPDSTPLLVSGETLLTPKRGLPDIFNQAAVEVVFDEIQETTTDPLPSDTLAQLIDPLNPRSVALAAIPGTVASELQTNGLEKILGSADGAIKLPASIRQRLEYDPLINRLSFKGVFDETGIGEPFLLLNVMSKRDRFTLKRLNDGNGDDANGFTGTCETVADGCDWDQAIEALFRLSRNPQGIEKICRRPVIDENRQRICEDDRPVTVDDVLVGYEDKIGNGGEGDGILEPFRASGVRPALSAGLSQGNGFVTVAFNNNEALNPLPVSLEVIRVGCLALPQPNGAPDRLTTYQGQIQVIEPDNIFDEQLVLRHSGDFGGNADTLDFQWFFHPDVDGNPPLPLPDPETGQLNGWIQYPVDDPQGAVEISIEGANIQTLSDNWYVTRYRGLNACGNQDGWSLYAGDPTATALDPSPQLAEGWVKRVLKRLNPFEARVQDFAQAATNNFASMLVQLGERYEGPVPLTNDPNVINGLGLIEAYTTVMKRALELSVKGTPPVDYGPANNAILLVASRLVDFYTLLGNEAFADAQDPTIGITTSSGDFSLAPTIFNFQNQMASVLEEELTLLRGRDTTLGGVAGRPVYNRLFWNFTTGDGEVAYAQSYNISDQNFDGVIDEFDARILYPQGHGDAWGHYLTATDIYYDLLNEEFYSWNPRIESILVAGAPINVDFLDERQFAETAAAKARAGAEIVDLTYRNEYVADPEGQYQGYEDTDEDRAWGLSEWGSRAGMGAYFDWVTINSILPSEDPDPTHVGIERVERGTVSELNEISAQYARIQQQVDEADAGLNPLGLADNVVTFDLNTSELDRFNKTNTEQVLDRAESALGNAVQVWDFANQLSNQMRRNQNEVEDIQRDSRAQENDFANQLIEIFGTPYTDDIGPAGTYPSGYEGPDVYSYMIIDVPALAGTLFDFDTQLNLSGGPEAGRVETFTGSYEPVPNGINFFSWEPKPPGEDHQNSAGLSCTLFPLSEGCALGDLTTEDDQGENLLQVEYTTLETPDLGLWFTKPENWTGQRRAPGQLQQILQQMLQSRIALKQALVSYNRLREEMEAKIDQLEATFDTTESNLNLSISQRGELKSLTAQVQGMRNGAIAARRVGELVAGSLNGTKECIPKSFIAGLAAGGDVTSPARCSLEIAGVVAKVGLDTLADGLDIGANVQEAAKEDVGQVTGIRTAINDAELDLFNLKGELDEMLREEPILRAEVFARTEAIQQHVNNYYATLARGLRTMERLTAFRKNGAAAVQEYRYQDMAFRIFRNDALQKYRASFDLAARYAYLAASAYDYETNLLGSDSQAGQEFLTEIVRERSLGQVLDGVPQPGSPGLASKLAELRLNFDVLKGQMGFNNPQVETNRFSLRTELFRIPEGPEGDAEWRATLQERYVEDLWALPEFKRFARPFAPQSAGPQPALVIEFPTNVSFGLNFFGWELGPGDSSYDSSQFATRIRSVGTWFADYADLPLADDPRVYLIPVGADVLRAPDPFDFRTREWQIVEQVMPVPFPISSQDLERFDWAPSETLSGSPTDIRRYGRYRAYHLTEPFDDGQVISDSRLVGRSVWNTKWLLIIPGGTFLNDPAEGLDTFIEGTPIAGGGGERDGQGVSDIQIFFKTYAYGGL